MERKIYSMKQQHIRPECSSPVIASSVESGYHAFRDDAPELLAPYLRRVVGSRDPGAEEKRVRHIIWRYAFGFLPLMLRRCGLTTKARECTELACRPNIDDLRQAARRWAGRFDHGSNGLYMLQRLEDALAQQGAMGEQQLARYEQAEQAARIISNGYSRFFGMLTRSDLVVLCGRWFLVLDEALNLGRQGEPWSADAIEADAAL
jgi:hypothetical protein